MGKKLISTYKFSPANVSPSLNQYPNAVNLLQLNEKYIIEEVIAYINYNVTNNIAPFIFYTYKTISKAYRLNVFIFWKNFKTIFYERRQTWRKQFK